MSYYYYLKVIGIQGLLYAVNFTVT